MSAAASGWGWSAREDDVVGVVLAVVFDLGGAVALPPEERVRGWVGAARDGDPDAARQLYRAHVAKVYRAVRPLCRDDAEAEDVTQETFARALEALDTYAPREGVRFVSWLLAIAMNVARKSHARRRRAVPTDPQTLDERDGGPDQDPGAAIDRRTLRAALLAALESLAPREREVVSLQYGGELTAKEIGELTGLEHAHVRKIAERARDALRREIERALAPRARTTTEEAR